MGGFVHYWQCSGCGYATYNKPELQLRREHRCPRCGDIRLKHRVHQGWEKVLRINGNTSG